MRHARVAVAGGLVAVWLAAGAAGVHAHGGGDGAEPRPVLDPLPPALAGMGVELRDTLGWQLMLANPTARMLEVLDEAGAPFLRIGPGGTQADLASSAWYRTLGPARLVPPGLAPGAAPRWRKASAEAAWGWFDPRLEPHAQASVESAGRWRVPLRVAGERVALSGRFVSEPAPAGRYAARLTSPSAPAPGVRVTLLPGRAPGLLVANASERTLLVLGAEGEPFLRLAPSGVEANLASPTWQQSARSASTPAAPEAAAPATLSGAPAPLWQRVSPVPRFAWVDPRALVRSAPADAARAGDLLEFAIPMRLGDEMLQVRGVVSWTPRAAAALVGAEQPGER